MTIDEIAARTTIRLWPECAEILGLSKSSIYSAAERHELPFVERVGGRYLVLVPRLLAWLGAKPPNGSAPAGGGATTVITAAKQDADL